MKLILISLFLGNFNATAYRSVPEQTDNSPFITSIGERVCKDGVAVSQDLLKSKKLKYGDWLYIEEVGLKRINDTMHPRFTNHVDVWLSTLAEEKKFHARYKGRKLKIWKVSFVENANN